MSGEKYVLIGAGSAMFTRGLVVDLLQSEQASEIALVDIDPHALEVVERLSRKMVAAKRVALKVSASVDRRDVLPGATVVISTIGVGGRQAWVRDVEIPRRHGIFVPVGDTVGPGGSSRALRMIPPMVEIAQDVLGLAPDALLFNHSNPLGPIVRAVNKATDAPMVGLCHGVHSTAGYLADILGVRREALEYTAVGRNHLTWFTSVRIGQRDAMPELRAIATRNLEAAPDQEDGSIVRGERISGEHQNAFSWNLLLTFGAFPAPGDRHVTEFFPQFFRNGEYFGMKLGVHPAAFDFENTIAFGDRIYSEMERDAFSLEPLADTYFDQTSGEHEGVIDIVDSIRNDRGRIYSANLPNRGAIPGLPDETVVEAPAIADGAGVRLIPQPPLPAHLLGTLTTRSEWDETIVDASLNGSRERFVQALVLDGHVDSLETANSLADELLAAQAEFLPWVRPAVAEDGSLRSATDA